MAGNPKLAARKVVTAAMEVTYGVDPVGHSGLLVSNLTNAPMAASVVKRQRAYQAFGADPSEVAQIYRTIGFEIEAAGSGAAGTAPLYGKLLRSCGMSETVTVATKTVYAPISSAYESTSHHFFWDSTERKLLGARGALNFKASGGALPMLAFQLSGMYSAVTDAAPPDVHADLEAFIDSIEVNDINTTFTLFGVAHPLESLSIDFGNKVVFRDRPNAEYIAITDRVVSGTLVIEQPTIATYDFFTAAKNKTTGALQLIQGTTAGNIVQVDAPRVRVLNPTDQDVNGVLCLSVPLEFCRVHGDDEITFTVK